MAKANTITIDHLEVRKKDLDRIKRAFKVKDNAEAVKAAIAAMTGKLDLESIFEKYKGVKIKKLYD